MKRVRITLAHTPRLNVHDGHGGVWVDGDEPEVPDEAADILVSMGLAKFIDIYQHSPVVKAQGRMPKAEIPTAPFLLRLARPPRGLPDRP